MEVSSASTHPELCLGHGKPLAHVLCLWKVRGKGERKKRLKKRGKEGKKEGERRGGREGKEEGPGRYTEEVRTRNKRKAMGRS